VKHRVCFGNLPRSLAVIKPFTLSHKVLLEVAPLLEKEKNKKYLMNQSAAIVQNARDCVKEGD
jgi:hypothetical protein